MSIWSGWAIVTILEVEKLKLDKESDLVVFSRWRVLQSTQKRYFQLSKMEYFQIWKSGYHSRQNNNMRYSLMFIFGREKVKVMTKLDAIEMKKVYVEIKTFLEQPFDALQLTILDSQKADTRLGQEREERTALNM